MKDSLAANQLAEPLFNRFAHVYIKTTTESWLKWASEHNIHPAIYSYIAYKKERHSEVNMMERCLTLTQESGKWLQECYMQQVVLKC